MNRLYRGCDPGAWAERQLTGINVPVRIEHTTVLPGDLVIANSDGVIFFPAQHAAEATASAAFTALQDAYDYELNAAGQNGGQLEGGCTPEKYAGLVKWVDARPDKLRRPRAEFIAVITAASQPGGGRGAAGGAAAPHLGR